MTIAKIWMAEHIKNETRGTERALKKRYAMVDDVIESRSVVITFTNTWERWQQNDDNRMMLMSSTNNWYTRLNLKKQMPVYEACAEIT